MTAPAKHLAPIAPSSNVSAMKPSLHPLFDKTSAETRVREAAASIGLQDMDRLGKILESMKEEFVVHAWQLPALDSAQWKSFGAPIGLSAAVKQLADIPWDLSSSASPQAESPSTKSVENSLLELGYSSGVDDGIFEDQEDEEAPGTLSESSVQPESHFISIPNIPEPLTKNCGDDEEKGLPSGKAGDNIALQLFPTSSSDKENDEDRASRTIDNTVRTVQYRQLKVDNRRSISASRRRHGRSSSLPDMLEQTHERKRSSPPNSSPYIASPEANARRFQSEWEEVKAVLDRLEVADQRAILAQLIIVANGQTQTARMKLVENVIARFRENVSARASEDLKLQLDLIVDHLRNFARLRSDQRRMFGKVLFSSLSQLHASPSKEGADEGNKQTTTKRQQSKDKVQPRRRVAA